MVEEFFVWVSGVLPVKVSGARAWRGHKDSRPLPFLELQSVIEADGTFQRWLQPCLLFPRLLHSVTFCSPMERLSLILLLNLGELKTALSSRICTGGAV